MFFKNEQAIQINDLIRRIHRRTGVPLTAVVTDRCDGYPEIPWKAFAAAIVLNGLVQFFQILFPPPQLSPWNVPRTMGFFIGTSAAVALLTIFWPAFGRVFLNRQRAEANTSRFAQTVFLDREMYQAPGRNALLLMVGVFESQAVLLADRALLERLTPVALSPVTSRMRPLLQRQAYFNALSEGLAALERTLLDAGFNSNTEATAPSDIGLVQLKTKDS